MNLKDCGVAQPNNAVVCGATGDKGAMSFQVLTPIRFVLRCRIGGRSPARRTQRKTEMEVMNVASSFGASVVIAASCVLNWTVGIGLYQNFVVIPSWFASPPASFARINQYGSSEVRFWIPMQSITVLALIGALVVGWNDPVHKPLIIAALVLYLVAIAMTAAYLAPRIVRWGKVSPPNGGHRSLWRRQIGGWFCLGFGRA